MEERDPAVHRRFQRHGQALGVFDQEEAAAGVRSLGGRSIGSDGRWRRHKLARSHTEKAFSDVVGSFSQTARS